MLVTSWVVIVNFLIATSQSSTAPPGCPGYADKFCDMGTNTSSFGTNTAACGWDGGDCCRSTCTANNADCSGFNFGIFDALYCQDPGVINNTVRIVPTTGDLTNLYPNSGRVEVFEQNEWGLICNKKWDLIDADVVCRQLKFAGVSAVSTTPGYPRQQFWLWDVICTGNEATVQSCPSKIDTAQQCALTSSAAGVTCSISGCPGVRILMVVDPTWIFNWSGVQPNFRVVGPFGGLIDTQPIPSFGQNFQGTFCLTPNPPFTRGNFYHIEIIEALPTTIVLGNLRIVVEFMSAVIYDVDVQSSLAGQSGVRVGSFRIPTLPPTMSPTHQPSTAPSTSAPSTSAPSTSAPSMQPSSNPSTSQPTMQPTTSQPSSQPTLQPSDAPTRAPIVRTTPQQTPRPTASPIERGGAIVGGVQGGGGTNTDLIITLVVVGAVVGLIICGLAFYAFYRRSLHKVKNELEYVAPAAIGMQSVDSEILETSPGPPQGRTSHIHLAAGNNHTSGGYPQMVNAMSVSSDYKAEELDPGSFRQSSAYTPHTPGMIERFITPVHPEADTEGFNERNGTALPLHMAQTEGAEGGGGGTGGDLSRVLPHRGPRDGSPLTTHTMMGPPKSLKPMDSVEDLFSDEYNDDDEDAPGLIAQGTQRRMTGEGGRVDSMYNIPNLPPAEGDGHATVEPRRNASLRQL